MMVREIINDLQKGYGDLISDIKERHNEYYILVSKDIHRVLDRFVKKHETSLISLFANDESNTEGSIAIYYAFSIEETNSIFCFQYSIIEEAIDSVTDIIHNAAPYEMEIRDLYGVVFKNHPDSRKRVFHLGSPKHGYPLKRDFNRDEEVVYGDYEKNYLNIDGTGVFEIPVGPIHAGIIEPGHFRFNVAGEIVINLEAELYYTHKGIESIAIDKNVNYNLLLSERISGDETIANSLAYSLAVEKAAGIYEIPKRADYSRIIFAEMERLCSHLGDIGGVCTDIAYGFAFSQFAMMRRWCQLANEQITGSRFLRNVIKPGGIRRDFLMGKESIIEELMDKISKEFMDSVEIIKRNSSYIDRVENTGVVSKALAIELHAVGPAARATAIHTDARVKFPYSMYEKLKPNVSKHNMGDVNCRVNVKIDEVIESIRLIREALSKMPSKGEYYTKIPDLKPFTSAFGITEAPRGENVHWIMTGENNTIYRYKIRTPSFCNWPVLCHAVKGNVVPDFPLINKSFNLSYSGNDL